MKQEKIWDSIYRFDNNKWKKEALDMPDLIKDKNVLEIGSGNGKSVKSILRLKPKAFTGIDISAESVRICNKEFPSNNFIKADVLKMPFKKGEFDVVVIKYILNNLLEKDRKKAISEVRRVLADSGKIIFEDFSKGDFRENKEYPEIEDNTYRKKNGLICHFFSEQEIKKLFNEFKIIIIRNIKRKAFGRSIVKRRILYGIFEKQSD